MLEISNDNNKVLTIKRNTNKKYKKKIEKNFYRHLIDNKWICGLQPTKSKCDVRFSKEIYTTHAHRQYCN